MAGNKGRGHREGSANDHSNSRLERTFELNWRSISTTRQDFLDTNCILSMLCSQLRGDVLDDEDLEQSRDTETLEDDSDFGDGEVEIWEFDTADQFDKQKSITAEAALKSRFLDRLAEVLARIKKPPEAVKQVASAYMAEIDNDDGSQRVEIRLAKNEGMSGEDDEYLKTLFGVLSQIARGETPPEKARETLLKQTICYASPRIDFYVEALRHEFSRKPRVQPSNPSKIQKLVEAATNPSGSLKSWSDEVWRDYDFATAGSETNDQGCALDQIDRLSCKARGEAYEDVRRDTTSLFQRVLDFCKTPRPPIEDLAEVIQSAFILQTDVRSRARFQGCFVGHFGLAFEAAARARRALLFLCRFYAAILVFTEAAIRLSSFRNMSFNFVKPFREVLPLQDGMNQKAVSDVLAGLSARSSEVLMTKLCRGESKTIAKVDKDFDKARRQPCHVHAEIQLVDNFENRREETGWRAHPYIGGSKLCCYLCDSFLRHHGFFQYRGSHWKIYHKWHVPEAFKTGKTALVFENNLRLVHREVVEHVRSNMRGEAQPTKDPLRPESTVDLSTAATVSTQEMAEMTLASPNSKWMGKGAIGPMVMDDAVLLVPDFQNPGRITVWHEGRRLETSIEDAELYKDKFERLKLLSNMNRRIRRRCHQPVCKIVPAFRCKACRASYCSRRCQNLDWHRHVFVCTVRGRPNLADSLVLLIRGAGDLHATESQDLLREKLLADKDVSTAFGFGGCETSEEVCSLIFIYRHLTSRKRSAVLLQKCVDHGELEEKIKASILARQEQRLPCHEWFLASTKLFQKRDSDMAAHVEYGFCGAMSLLMPNGSGYGDVTDAEYRVLWLYSHLLKDFDDLPNRSHSAWLDFGFCFCQSREWMVRMADAYMELAMNASFSEIVNFWDTYSRLDGLFEAKGINIATFKRAGISFGRPTKMERGVYQLMVEINHVHRGIWCRCGTFHERSCKRFPESRFSTESVVDYGFDKLSPWERWEMIVLWEDIFTSKNFDAREMLAARRSEDHRALQNYVERMVDTRSGALAQHTLTVMASRQKSFFDQGTKARPFWRKDWKANIDTRGPQQSLRPAAAMAPIAASSQSKSKLKAFQYEERDDQPRAKMAEADKENAPHDAEKTNHHMIPPPQPLSQRSATKGSRDCPQTPVGRLPLSELLASGEDTSRQHLNPTPVERVLWENSPMSSTSPARRRQRKRAHSTSPASSSQNETSTHFAGAKSAVDLHTLQKNLKTPKADPADDLWSRYSLNTDNIEGRSPTAPAGMGYYHLMHSSPQTPASHLGRDSGLRRALSCIEWPTSVAKRRKLHHSSSQGDPAKHGGLCDSIERSKMSRVSFLVEKIHDGLSKPSVPHHDDSSEAARSSPAPHANNSPSGDTTLDYRESETAIDDVANVLSQTVVAAKENTPQRLILSAEEIADLGKDATSSDFGDDDLDLEMLEHVGTKAEAACAKREEFAKIDPDGSHAAPGVIFAALSKSGDLPPVTSIQGDNYSDVSFPSNVSSYVRAPAPDCDEFDDDDDDVSAADLEDVFAKYDSQLPRPESRAVDIQQENGANNQRASNTGAGSNIGTVYQFPQAVDVEVLSDDDEFGDDSDFEQIAAECAEATQKQQVSQPQSSHDSKMPTLQRYLILAVADGQYKTSNGRVQPEKVLSVQCERTKIIKVIVLRQSWIESPCFPGAYLHLIGDFDRVGQCVVDNTHNLLILHPDHLISSTVVGDSFTCTRKAVLQDRVKTTSDANQSTIYGSMLHEIFQEAMRANRWDDEFMTTTIETIASQYLETLFEIQIQHSTAVEHLKARAVELQAWAEIFVSAKPKPNAVVKDRNGASFLMSVNKLLEVEEKVWSPLYGLKGNVDATVQVLLRDGNDDKTLTVPFELKTGKHQSAAHKAQTSLYTLLLSDRYDVEIACGILYYMQTSEISTIPTIRHELIPMIMQRNELASYVRHRLELPPMIKRPYTCNKCYAQTPCFIYHKLVDDGSGETSGLGDTFNDMVKHLHPSHQQFFSKWDALLTKEEKDIVKFRRELWTMQSSEREKVGRCFGGLVIDKSSFQEVEGASKINRFRYTFIKQNLKPGFNFTKSQITLGEPVVISDETGHFALANGYVTSVRKHRIQVTIDRRLHNARVKGKNFDAERNQSFTGIMEIVENGSGQCTQTPPQPGEPVIYRLDKDEFSNGMAMIRNNLIRLMEKDVFGVQALRKLIVEGVAPTFKPKASRYTLANTASQASLNVDQRAAIEKVMSAKDYALVLGMPGTGKTTTIAHIIRALVAQGKSVLLTSYTHTAVDNILLKLRNDEIGIFRLGSIAKVHPEVQEFASLAGFPLKTIEEIKESYLKPIVATTCLGINHHIFNQRVFDYCIVDEASQITLPVCLGPIRMARTFILVGDHYQLPPLVQNDEAKEGGLDISLFKMLSDKHPESVVNLEHQYRMCEDIMTLSNTLIYDGRLKCGTQAVANRSITIPNVGALKQHHHKPQSILSADPRNICANPTRGSCWLRDLLDASVKACFVNTDALIPLSREVLESGGNRITNPCEVTITTQLVESLITTGVLPTDIGVITLYRSQLALIKQSLRQRSGVEMHTADKFQGRDKEVVVLSLVRSNENQMVGDLLKDWRRVNVALTRARTKLLVIGSKSTLVCNELLKDFVRLMEEKGWCYNLPIGACGGHLFEDCATQISAKGSADAKMESPMKAGRQVLGEGSGNRMGVGKKMPAKQGKLNMNALLGKRAVLRDIVNDAL